MIVAIDLECPHCGEMFASTADTSEGSYETVEDCSVCCRPMVVRVECEPGKVQAVWTEPC